MKDQNASLGKLLQRPDIWQASRAANEGSDSLPTGQAKLDTILHYGGWPRSAITEVLSDLSGCGEMSLLLPALSHCSGDPRWLLMIAPPCLPYAPALQSAGIALDKILIAAPRTTAELLWCAEQSLRSTACSGLLVWLPDRGVHYRDLRRLQLAARISNSLVFFFRPSRAARELSPAALRVQLSADPQHLNVHILKQRGGPAGQRVQLARSQQLLAPRIPARKLPVPARRHPVSAQDTHRLLPSLATTSLRQPSV